MKRIMVVDDEPDTEYLFSRKFKKEVKAGQIEFVFAISGQTALSHLESSENISIDLVISDINLPEMNGLELLKQIKEKKPHLNVFILTAHGYDENYKLARESGANEYLVKPIDFAKLKEKFGDLGLINELN
ncbi:response regulator [Okeania sp.]|uniref:response regulator n=1 Tax=Okeania sp. TaxID=3100323 RepID=UPI002B4AFE6F|nr:response regulator [Okeania sp.]MEB3340699.1 response regulator [Okeania sp.]